jgi:hypothetical protein
MAVGALAEEVGRPLNERGKWRSNNPSAKVEANGARGEPMSKAARNEHRKIEAAYLNNVAAGIIVVGGFLPVFAITVLEAPPTTNRLIAGGVLLVGSWALSRILHKGALKRAAEIED